MSLNQFAREMIPAVEETMQACLAQVKGSGLEQFYAMLAYHLGWEGEGSGPEARGKHIRPLLVLLSTAAVNGDWRKALPAAAAVELLHNFSLIHDDIEDNSPLRRGRRTVWHIWGVPQAINAGDAMLSLAHMALLDLDKYIPASTTCCGCPPPAHLPGTDPGTIPGYFIRKTQRPGHNRLLADGEWKDSRPAGSLHRVGRADRWC